ncbi:hypothetical protein [Burkholderia pyrrocinia]
MISIVLKSNCAFPPISLHNNSNSDIEKSSNFWRIDKNVTSVKNSLEPSGCRKWRDENKIQIASKFRSKESAIKNNELKWMHAEASSKPGVDAKNIQLAAYLTARSTLYRTIEGDQLHGLRKANDSVNEARDLLPYGRANVTTDVAKSPETYWRWEYLQTGGRGNGSVARATAVVMKVGADCCGGHALVTAGVHSGKLSAGETLLPHCDARDFDHAWTETIRHDGDRIIMDAWADGPAVMAEDSKFSPSLDCRDSNMTLQQESGRKFNQEINDQLDRFTASGEVDSACSEYVEWKNNYWLGGAPKGNYPPTLVLHPKFNASVTKKQDPAHVVKVLGEDGANTCSNISAKLKLGMEVKAVGAARSLGANIRQALDTKGQILAVLDKNSADKTDTSFFRENIPLMWKSEKALKNQPAGMIEGGIGQDHPTAWNRANPHWGKEDPKFTEVMSARKRKVEQPVDQRDPAQSTSRPEEEDPDAQNRMNEQREQRNARESLKNRPEGMTEGGIGRDHPTAWNRANPDWGKEDPKFTEVMSARKRKVEQSIEQPVAQRDTVQDASSMQQPVDPA